MPRFILLEFFRLFFIIRSISKFFSIFQYTMQLNIKISECFNIYCSLTDLSFTKIQMLNSNQGGMPAQNLDA